MKMMYGVVVPMTTPFNESGHVDIKALEEEIDFLIEKGVHGLYPCGTTGEMLLMDLSERELVAETVVKRAAGRVTVYIQCGAIATRDTLRLARHAKKIGADGIGIVTPPFFGISEKAMIGYYTTIAKSLPDDFPIYLYNIPQCSANDIMPNVCKVLAETCPNIIGIKYSGSDLNRIFDYLRIKEYGFSVLVGADKHFLSSMVDGCKGTVSGCAGIFPEVFVDIYNTYQTGDIDKALQLQRKANRVIEILKNGCDLSIFKEALKMRGLKSGYVRAPLMNISEAERNELADNLKFFLKEY